MGFFDNSHISRGWPGMQPVDIEAECPCPKEPCGHIAVKRIDQSCDQHAFDRSKTIRSSHPARECPAIFRTPLEG